MAAYQQDPKTGETKLVHETKPAEPRNVRDPAEQKAPAKPEKE